MAQAPAGTLKLFLDCPRCDAAALKTAIPFAEFVAADTTADVAVAIAVDETGASHKWTLVIKGRGPFAGRDRTISFEEDAATPPARTKAMLARYVKLGIAEFAAGLPVGRQLDLGFQKAPSASGASPIQKDQKDPWNHWVFRLGASVDAYGEQSSSSNSHSFSGSANRATDRWRLRLNGSRYVSKSSFDLDEETTIKSDSTSWNVDGLAVKSLTPRWSAALQMNTAGATFSNQELYARVAPGIEFDVFPYAESSKRSLTFQYLVGVARYSYRNVTIFDKLDENVVQHNMGAYFGLRMPWGQLGASSTFSQQLTALDRTRLNLNANGNIRLYKSLTLNASANYSRIRDQFTLEKGTASEEEVLLRLRQLATGYRYNFNVGFSYAFGALSNTIVNPRFGG